MIYKDLNTYHMFNAGAMVHRLPKPLINPVTSIQSKKYTARLQDARQIRQSKEITTEASPIQRERCINSGSDSTTGRYVPLSICSTTLCFVHRSQARQFRSMSRGMRISLTSSGSTISDDKNPPEACHAM
jgi:hypothetical protein